MKVLVLMAVLVAFAAATPRQKRSVGGQAGGTGEGRPENGVNGPAPGSQGNSAEGSQEDFIPQPISPSQFKDEMEEMVGEVKAAKGKLEAAAWAAGAVYENASEGALETVAKRFREQAEHNGHMFDRVAQRLVQIMFRLYAGSDGFAEADRCQTIKHFEAELNDPEDPTQRKAYMKELAGHVWIDLWCFSSLYGQVDTIDLELMTNDEYTEADAAHLVSTFLREIHLVRKNTQRFNIAVGKAYSKLENNEGETVDEEERQLKRLLKRLLADSRGIKK
ncbi:uncharacterized protein [Littorina saxatilis]|uniref:Secreted protein n=1 Tax=Littorina saxatilis TaxID=31220 RepID=A0AAN9BKQ6_9CAEN